MMDSQDIFNSSLAIFSTATFMDIENSVDKIHKYIAQESNVKDMHRLIKMILDIVRIKKISEEEKVFLLKKASEYYTQEMMYRYLYTTRYMDENVKDRSPFSDIALYVEHQLVKHHVEKKCHCSKNSNYHRLPKGS